MKPLLIKNLQLNNQCKAVNFESEMGQVVFVKSADGSFLHSLNFLKCIAGVIEPFNQNSNVFYKEMPVHKFKKSYFKRGRVFVGEGGENYCYGLFRKFKPKILQPNKTLWKNLASFAKINKNEEFVYAAVHFFLFHENIHVKVKNLQPCEQELAKLATLMFFENIDLWIVFVDDENITDPADHKIIRHLFQSRASDCEGLVIYTTKTQNSLFVANETQLVL